PAHPDMDRADRPAYPPVATPPVQSHLVPVQSGRAAAHEPVHIPRPAQMARPALEHPAPPAATRTARISNPRFGRPNLGDTGDLISKSRKETKKPQGKGYSDQAIRAILDSSGASPTLRVQRLHRLLEVAVERCGEFAVVGGFDRIA